MIVRINCRGQLCFAGRLKESVSLCRGVAVVGFFIRWYQQIRLPNLRVLCYADVRVHGVLCKCAKKKRETRTSPQTPIALVPLMGPGPVSSFLFPTQNATSSGTAMTSCLLGRLAVHFETCLLQNGPWSTVNRWFLTQHETSAGMLLCAFPDFLSDWKVGENCASQRKDWIIEQRRTMFNPKKTRKERFRNAWGLWQNALFH